MPLPLAYKWSLVRIGIMCIVTPGDKQNRLFFRKELLYSHSALSFELASSETGELGQEKVTNENRHKGNDGRKRERLIIL